MEIDRLKSFLDRDPKNLSLMSAIADSLIEAGRSKEALEYIHRALEVDPESKPFLYRKAIALRRSGSVELAREQLRALLNGSYVDPAIRYELASIEFADTEFQACAELLEGLSAEERSRIRGCNLLLVRALHYLGDLDRAIAIAEPALGSDPELLAPLATLYLDAERLEDAARLYGLNDAGVPRSPELECVGGYLALTDERVELAQRRFEDVLRVRSSDGRALLGSGLASAAQGDLPRAIEKIRHAADAMPKHLGTLIALGWMQLMNGQIDAADETLKRAQAVDDTFAESYGGQAVVAAMRGEREAALALMRTALRLDRECFSAAYASMLLQQGGKPDSAMLAAMQDFLSGQIAPGGGTMKDAVLRMARGSHRGATSKS